MKKSELLIGVIGLLIGTICIADVSDEYAADTTRNVSTPIINTRTDLCYQWKQVCYEREHCTRRTSMRRDDACYRCIKPRHYGFHLYPRQIDRNTCNLKTAQYLETMGYRCYHPYGSQPCERSIKTQLCDFECVQYEKSTQNPTPKPPPKRTKPTN